MQRVKIIIKRPTIHYIISLGYILAPIVNILLLLIIIKLPLNMVLRHLFRGYGYLAAIWLLTAPIVGIGLYFVHKVSWYLFLAHSGLILLDYILKWTRLPRHYWISIPEVHQILIFVGNMALIVAIGYIIQKDFRSPYFQVLPRSWRRSRRVPIRHRIILNGETRPVSDVSTTGCFVSESDFGLEIGEKVSISFKADALTIDCRGEVMRIIPDGYGLRFMGLSFVQKQDIRRMLASRYAFRYEVNVACTWVSNSHSAKGTIQDISTSGCFVQGEVTEVVKNQRGTLRLASGSIRRNVRGTIVWVKSSSDEKQAGCAVQFSNNQRRMVNRILKQQGKKEVPA
jgi:hypothetical protein